MSGIFKVLLTTRKRIYKRKKDKDIQEHERTMITRSYKIYGLDGHRQRESFRASDNFTTWSGNKVEVWNSDKTGTNEYSIIRITAESEKACFEELNAQLSDGVFENSRVGRIEAIDNVEEA